MAEKEILYLTYKDEKMEEGLSYAIYLAGHLNAGLRIVLLERLSLGERYDNIMSAITFAEANEHSTARALLAGDSTGVDGDGTNGKDTASLYSYLRGRCGQEGVEVNIHTAHSDNAGSIKDFLRYKKTDMVVLSPAVTKSTAVLKRLAKISPAPVVTMAR